MSNVVAIMSMSLDGYIAGSNDEPSNPGGDGFDRLHEWIISPDGEFGRPSGPAGQLWDEWNATGAVLAGRRTVEQVDHWGGDHHGVPIFVLTRAAPTEPPSGSARYVTDIASCVAEAKAAAGDRDVLLHGAATAQECLRAGLLDEMQLSVVPVLLGRGRRLFDDLPHVELELVRVLDGPAVQHLGYRVER
jgi:dihydrofolate reductase